MEMGKVHFKNTGEDEEVNKGEKIMEASQKAGWPIAYGCEDGLCGTCVVRVAEGEEHLEKPDDKESQTLDIMGLAEGGFRLACQCKMKDDGDVTIEQ